MNSYSWSWNTPYQGLIVTAGEFQKCNLDFRRTICNKILFYTWKTYPAMKAGSTAKTQRPKDRVLSGSMLALPDPRRPDRANPPQTFDDLFFF